MINAVLRARQSVIRVCQFAVTQHKVQPPGFCTTGQSSCKSQTCSHSAPSLAEELDAEAGHADADTELKLRVMAMDAVRPARRTLTPTNSTRSSHEDSVICCKPKVQARSQMCGAVSKH